MKKIILVLSLFILSTLNVNAASNCYPGSISELNNTTVDIDYDSNYYDAGGEKEYKYFRIKPVNMSSEFVMYINDGYENQVIFYDESTALSGGVYTVTIKYKNCDNVLKEFQIFVPYYKNASSKDLKDNGVLFDGTYENKGNDSKKQDDSVSYRLVIVLVGLIIVVAILLFVFIRANKKRRSEL